MLQCACDHFKNVHEYNPTLDSWDGCKRCHCEGYDPVGMEETKDIDELWEESPGICDDED